MRLQLFLLLVAVSLAAAENVYKLWTLTWLDDVTIDPATFNGKRMIAVNGTWPPPTITLNVNDTLYLNVVNNLGSGYVTTLHAHGFLQMNNNPYDGPEGV